MDTDTAQFAAQSETKTFFIKYNDPEEVADRLREPGVRIKPLLSKNMLVVQALPEKMKEIEKKLKKIDSPANPYQVRYNLYIIKLKSEIAYGIGLRDMELEEGTEENIQFLLQKDLVELAGKGVLSYLRSRLQQNQASMQRVAQPSLVAGIDTTSSLALNREVVNLAGDENLPSDEFNLKLTPEFVIQESEEVKTTIDFSSSSFIKSELTSSVKTKYNKPELIAVFSQRKESSNKTSLKSSGEDKQSNYFALYLAASPVGSLPDSNSSAFDLGGLGSLLEEKKVKPKRERIDVLYASSLGIDISVQNPEERQGFNFKIQNIGKSSNPYLQIGPDFYLMEELKLGTYLQVKDDKNRFKIGIKDRVKINNGIHLSAGYYPWFYNLTDKKIEEEKNWWVQSELKYKRLFLDLKYNEVETSVTENSWRGLVGCQIIDPFSIVVGIEKDQDEDKRIIGGITLESW